jgi:hypothetical protein
MHATFLFFFFFFFSLSKERNTVVGKHKPPLSFCWLNCTTATAEERQPQHRAQGAGGARDKARKQYLSLERERKESL